MSGRWDYEFFTFSSYFLQYIFESEKVKKKNKIFSILGITY